MSDGLSGPRWSAVSDPKVTPTIRSWRSVASEDSTKSFAVVHLVVQESTKALIESQVVDHMEWQASAPGVARPSTVVVALLEPLRVAVRPAVRKHVRNLRRRAPAVLVRLFPFVGRAGLTRNARILAVRLRRLTKENRVVFHCRNDAAAEWALALQKHFAGSTFILDVRGPWAEEQLYQRRFMHVDGSNGRTNTDYDRNLAHLRMASAQAPVIMTVSHGMMRWLTEKGISAESTVYVPCCVRDLTYDPARRTQTRRRLGLDDKKVFVYLGSVSAQQYLIPEVIPFVAEAMRQCDDVHFLALTRDVAALHTLLRSHGVSEARVTIRSVRQEDVSALIEAGDAGLILTQPGTLAGLVQPVKLGEYVAAGLPVVVSRSALCVAAIVERYRAGVIVDIPADKPAELQQSVRDVMDALANRASELRSNALRLCKEELLWSVYTDTVRNAYLSALHSESPVVESPEQVS